MKRSEWHGNGNILMPFPSTVSQLRQTPDAWERVLLSWPLAQE